MPAPLASAIGMTADHDHAYGRDAPRNHAQQAHFEKIFLVDAEFLNDGRHPEIHRVETHHATEINHRQGPDTVILEGIEKVMLCPDLGFGLIVLGDPLHDQRFLLVGQPFGFLRSIIKPDQHHCSNNDRRNTFQQEQPLPAAPAVVAIHVLHDGAGYRRTDHVGNGDCRHEQGHHFGAARTRKPVSQVKDDAGEKTRFGNTERETQKVKSKLGIGAIESGCNHAPVNIVGKHECRGDYAPGNHDARDPHLGADSLENNVARHFK